MSYTKTRVGLVGFGTVGAGVADLLLNNADIIRAKTGMDIELATVIDLDTKRPRPVELPAGLLTDNLDTLLADKTIDIGIELVGGTSFARDLHLKMLAAGKHVVTANKALLAEHGAELFAAARKAGKCIAFEASCAGGIPIISAIRSGLAANRASIHWPSALLFMRGGPATYFGRLSITRLALPTTTRAIVSGSTT